MMYPAAHTTMEGQTSQLLSTQAMVMSLDGFVASLGIMESVMKRLVADVQPSIPLSGRNTNILLP